VNIQPHNQLDIQEQGFFDKLKVMPQNCYRQVRFDVHIFQPGFLSQQNQKDYESCHQKRK